MEGSKTYLTVKIGGEANILEGRRVIYSRNLEGCSEPPDVSARLPDGLR